MVASIKGEASPQDEKKRKTKVAKERRIRDQIVQEVTTGIQKEDIDESVENKVKRTGGCKASCEAGIARRLTMKRRRKAGKKGTTWQRSGMKSKKMEEILEQRVMEGSLLQFEVMRRVPKLVVHERMSQGQRVKGLKEKKKVSGWSMEEMKEKLSVAE